MRSVSLVLAMVAALAFPVWAQERNVDTLGEEASGHFQHGRLKEAEALMRQALAISVRAGEEQAVALSTSFLALILKEQGKDGEAEPFLRRSRAIFEKLFDAEFARTMTSVDVVRQQFQNLNRAATAERQVAERERTFGPEHLEVAEALDELAFAFLAQGREAERIDALRRRLAILEKRLGQTHPDVTKQIDVLGGAIESLGIRTTLQTQVADQSRFAEAEQLFRRSLANKEQVYGRDHAEVASALDMLAEALKWQGRFSDAVPLVRRSLAIKEKALGVDHIDTSKTRHDLEWFEEHARKAP